MGCPIDSATETRSSNVARVTPWPTAERLFRGHHPWLGGDDAYSIQLAPQRHVWLFGDSWIACQPESNRGDSALINSSIAIQNGDDPETAAIEFFWREGPDGTPGAVFSSPNEGLRVWPGHGARIGAALVVFLMEYQSLPSSHPDQKTLSSFDLRGWQASRIVNPDAHPRDWDVEHLEVPDLPWIWLLGIGGVLHEGDHVYVHAIGTAPRSTEPVYVARYRCDDLEAGHLDRLTFWCGDTLGWLTPEQGAQAHAVHQAIPSVTEFTIHRDPTSSQYQCVTMKMGADAHVQLRTAPSITGPWSSPERILDPPERHKTTHVYAAKAHPAIGNVPDVRQLLLTYNSNTNLPDLLLDRDDLYYPHCHRLQIAADASSGEGPDA
ncbi:MAG: hypothetical protein ACI867_000002 [Glaciecola sp.]